VVIESASSSRPISDIQQKWQTTKVKVLDRIHQVEGSTKKNLEVLRQKWDAFFSGAEHHVQHHMVHINIIQLLLLNQL
jgi:hypothetical protein